MKFIHQEAAKQRGAQKLQWWEKLASPTKKQWAYANAFHRAEDYVWQRGALVQKKKETTASTRHSPSAHAKEETPPPPPPPNKKPA